MNRADNSLLPSVKIRFGQRNCPRCGNQLSFIQQCDQWYCYPCRSYQQPVLQPPPPQQPGQYYYNTWPYPHLPPKTNYIPVIVIILVIVLILASLSLVIIYNPFNDVTTLETTTQPPTYSFSPSDGATITDNSPYISWNSVLEAGAYNIQVDNSSSFSNPIVDKTVLSANYLCTSLLPDGTYYWRVRTIQNGEWSSWSTVWNFVISDNNSGNSGNGGSGNTTITAPRLFSPLDGAIISDQTPYFSWSYDAGVSYQLQVDGSSTFSNPKIDQTVLPSYYISTVSLTDDTWYWRVRSKEASTYSPWGSIYSFTVITTNHTDTGNTSTSMVYTWDYNGKTWTLTFNIPQSTYEFYKNKQRTYGNYGVYVTYTDSSIVSLATLFNDKATQEGFNSYEKVSFIMAFVQSLPYTVDQVTTGYDEYPRYPIETLYENGGDCEDTSILFASLIYSSPMNIGCVLLELPAVNPTHMAVGVLGDGIPGAFTTYDNKKYYYCETTGDGWKIGDIPDEYIGVIPKVVTF